MNDKKEAPKVKPPHAGTQIPFKKINVKPIRRPTKRGG